MSQKSSSCIFNLFLNWLKQQHSLNKTTDWIRFLDPKIIRRRSRAFQRWVSFYLCYLRGIGWIYHWVMHLLQEHCLCFIYLMYHLWKDGLPRTIVKPDFGELTGLVPGPWAYWIGGWNKTTGWSENNLIFVALIWMKTIVNVTRIQESRLNIHQS